MEFLPGELFQGVPVGGQEVDPRVEFLKFLPVFPDQLLIVSCDCRIFCGDHNFKSAAADQPDLPVDEGCP